MPRTGRRPSCRLWLCCQLLVKFVDATLARITFCNLVLRRFGLSAAHSRFQGPKVGQRSTLPLHVWPINDCKKYSFGLFTKAANVQKLLIVFQFRGFS